VLLHCRLLMLPPHPPHHPLPWGDGLLGMLGCPPHLVLGRGPTPSPSLLMGRMLSCSRLSGPSSTSSTSTAGA
jgi:hypothetical protein